MIVEEFSIRKGSGGAGRWRRRRRDAPHPVPRTDGCEHSQLHPSPDRAQRPCGQRRRRTGRNWIERADGTTEELGATASGPGRGRRLRHRNPRQHCSWRSGGGLDACLIGIAIIIADFLLRFNPLSSSWRLALATGLAAGLERYRNHRRLWQGVQRYTRYVSIVWIVLPVIGLLEAWASAACALADRADQARDARPALPPICYCARRCRRSG